LEIELAKYMLRIKFLKDCRLPVYKGTTFRGAFGSVFKKVVCVNKGSSCSDCLLKAKCAYSYIFETPVPDDSERMKLYTNAPHPFIIEPPESTGRLFKKDEQLVFNAVIIGKAIEYLPYFILTFMNMGRAGLGKDRAGFELLSIVETASEKEIFNSRQGEIIDHDPKKLNITGNGNEKTNRVKLNFLTPARIKYKGHISDQLDFHIIVRNLLRRFSNICYFHCGKELKVDFKRLIRESEKIEKVRDETAWVEFERYSTRQGSSMKLGGVVGEIDFEGDIAPFNSFLDAGRYIHVGKLTGFGFGKYSLER